MKSYLRYLLSAIFVMATVATAIAQQHSFKHYRVSIFRGHPARVIIKGNPLAEQYKTIISDTYKSTAYMRTWHGATGLNFGGHYCFAYWGCGSNCQDGAIVDLKTGIVYQGLTAAMGYDFKVNSRLVIVNPGQTIDSCAVCASEYWVWNERTKVFRKLH